MNSLSHNAFGSSRRSALFRVTTILIISATSLRHCSRKKSMALTRRHSSSMCFLWYSRYSAQVRERTEASSLIGGNWHYLRFQTCPMSIWAILTGFCIGWSLVTSCACSPRCFSKKESYSLWTTKRSYCRSRTRSRVSFILLSWPFLSHT